jgi:hypothetical protein
MSEFLNPYVSDRGATRIAEEWLDRIDPRAAVGTRHHIVPRFLLARFASQDGKLRVRQRENGKGSIRSIGDLAVRDFYTSVTTDATFDSRLESLFSTVEGAAARLLRRHLDHRSFARVRRFTPEERAYLDTFSSLQAVRGMRLRRGIEVLGDFYVKFVNDQELSDAEIAELSFVPHPNEHLQIFGGVAERIESNLKRRSTSLVWLDSPLLVIGDEPVVLVHDDQRLPSQPEPDPRYVAFGEGRGFANAEAILLPLGPSVALMYGAPDLVTLIPEIQLSGDDAQDFADLCNRLVIEGAMDWVAAHPDHDGFNAMTMPASRPIFNVIAHASRAAEQVNNTPARRPRRRIRPEDLAEGQRPK